MQRFLFCLSLALSGVSFHLHAQVINTIAGSGARGFGGDYDTATSAQLGKPKGIAVDKHSNVYIADRENNRIRRITFTTGIITTIAGADSSWVNTDGVPATTALILLPSGVAVDAVDNVYLTDATHRIRKIDRAGIITTLAGTGAAGFSGDEGPATAAQLNDPADLTIDANGNIYFADVSNNRIRKIDSLGVMHTIAGTGVAGYSGDSGPAPAAQLNAPTGLCIDGAGNVLVADALNNRIRKIDRAGNIVTIAGTGVAGFSIDSVSATTAKVNEPGGIATDESGNIYITDCANHRVRKIIAESGIITTIAGTGEGGYSGDGGLPTAATLFYPACIAVDNMGNVYFTDLGNHCVRKIDAVISR